ncbi:hypothetical protein BHAOGJBA_6208 [Methylobacterium hispanicum]|jgi:hypothetical protein|uniref:Uncharacterized protein n=1 Tax=Methylobacterium hispanicum TaxID=270350 RepID=A0AAV4ZX11_9HYPH|nr:MULTISPECIES: hypothetical protein [Methylobacterium]GJD92652.1 hypothetical protein BHAOGJBA_6208 [Methylobacterium hispanicum]
MSEEAIHLDWHRAEAADPIERVARALCRHDNKDPDAMASIGPKEVGIADDGIAEMRRAEEPAWMEYAKEAERLVAAFRAFQAGPDQAPIELTALKLSGGPADCGDNLGAPAQSSKQIVSRLRSTASRPARCHRAR